MSETVYVFRLTAFDKDGNKVAKRKYGYTAKTGDASDLDDVVYRGIKSRAETAFALQPSRYFLWLVLPEGHNADSRDAPFGLPYLPTTTGEVVLYNYVGSFGTFKRFRQSMVKTPADGKGRKVINLCIVPDDYVMPTEKIKAVDNATGAMSAVPTALTNAAQVSDAVPAIPAAGGYVPNIRTTIGQVMDDARASADAINAQVNAQIQDQLSAIRQNAERTRSEAAQMASAVAAQANATAIAVSGDVARARSAIQAAIKADVEKSVNDSKATFNHASETVKKMAKEYIDMSGLIHGTDSEAHARFSQDTESLVQTVLSNGEAKVTLEASATAATAPREAEDPARTDNDLQEAMDKAFAPVGQTRPFFPKQSSGSDVRVTAQSIRESMYRTRSEKSGRDPSQYQHAFGAYAKRHSPFVALLNGGVPEAKAHAVKKKDVACEICSVILPNEAVLAKHMLFHPHVNSKDAGQSVHAHPSDCQAQGGYRKPPPPPPRYAAGPYAWTQVQPPPRSQFQFGSASNGWTPASGPWSPPALAQHISRSFANFSSGTDAHVVAARADEAAAVSATGANAPPAAGLSTFANAAQADLQSNTDAVDAGAGTTTAGNKYTALKKSMDRFVAEFNDAMADMFAMPAEQQGDAKVERAEPAVLEGEGEHEPADASTKTVPAEGKAEESEPHKHRATCDVCGIWIVGLRFKCIDCPDWDCCSQCCANAGDAHPEHTLVKIVTPSDLVAQSRKVVRHNGIYCDSCNKPIGGIRYKCTHTDCADFDLCAQCEADPTSYAVGRKIGAHDFNTHIMLKLRHPVGRFGARMSASPARNLSSAIGQARRFLQQGLPQSAQPEVAIESGSSATTDKTLIVDVPVPFAVANGQQEISIPLDIGRNSQGEAVILGLAKDFATVISSAVDAVKEGFKQASPAITEEAAAGVIESAADSERVHIITASSQQAQNFRSGSDVSDVSVASAALVAKTDPTNKEKEDALDASWLADLTFEDGAAVAPGTMFNKVWSVKNTGKTAWPAGTQLVCVGGFGGSSSIASSRSDVRYDLVQADVGEIVSVTAGDIIAPEVPGKFMSYYRFVSPGGHRFGDRLWLDINVEEHEGRRSIAGSYASSNENSLHNSSVITPSIKVKGASPVATKEITHEAAIMSASPSQATAVTTLSALTSPRSAISELADDDHISTLASTSGEVDDDFVLLSDEDDDFAEIASVASSG